MSPAFKSSSLTAYAAGHPAACSLASCWSPIVRGEPDAASFLPSLSPRPELADRSSPAGFAPDISASPAISIEELAEQGSGGNVAGKKARNVVMGDTWPELSESADSFAKPASSEVVPDGSGTAREAPQMAPPKTSSYNPNPNPNSNPSLSVPARQKSFPKTNPIKRTGSGCGTQANGSLSSSRQSPTWETTPIALGEGSSSSLTVTPRESVDRTGTGSNLLPNYVPAPPPNDPLECALYLSSFTAASIVYLAPLDQLRRMILKQIEYYFSFENLLKDTYLRQKIDDQGWVSISLVSGFNRGKKIRQHYDRMTRILPSLPDQHGIVSRPQYSLTSSVDSILAHVQSLGSSESASRLSNSSHRSPPAIGGRLNRTVSENWHIRRRRDGASANAIDKV